MAFCLVLSSVSASVPFIASEKVAALSGSTTVCASGCDYTNLQEAIDNAATGDTIDLLGNLSTTAQVTIDKSLTINGMGHTISPVFPKTGNDNNTVLAVIGTTDVTVENLIIDGVGGTNLHGFQAYDATGVVLKDVESKNNDRTGVLVNGSTVNVHNLTTSGNGWHGVNVDQGTGVTSPAVLTINGVSRHTDTVHILVDDVTKNITVIDTNKQYAVTVYGNTAIHTLKPTTPTILTPTNEQYFASSPINAAWTASTSPSGIAGYQIAYHYDDGHSFSNSTCPTLNIEGYSGFIGCRDITTTSRNHTPNLNEQGGVSIWVRARDNAGIYSNWSAPVHYQYDATAPTIPTPLSPADGVVVNGASITQSWSDSSSDVDHYVYESYNDSGATSLRWHQEYSTTSKTATHVAESTYWWRVKAVDHAGNESGWSPLWKITVDNTAPTATIDNAAPKAYYNGATNINVHAIDANYAKTELYRNSNTTPFKTYTDSYFGLFWLTDGYYRMDVIDQAGNMTEYTFTIDTTRPLVSASNESRYNPLSLMLTASDSGSGVQKVTGNIYKLDTADNLYKLFKGNSSTSLNPLTVNLSTLADGQYYVRYNAADKAGNISVTSTFNFTVDHTAPAVPVHQTPFNNAVQNVNNFWFDWNDVEGAVSYEAQFSQSNSTDPVTGSLNSGGVWAGDANHNQPTESRAWSAGANGTWYWQVRSVDAAGNKSAWSTPWKLTIDMDKPSAPVVTATDVENYDVTKNSPVEINWTKPTDDTVKYDYRVWTNAAGSIFNSENSAYVAAGLTGNSRTGAFNQGDGSYFVQVRAIDAAGNVSDWSDTFTVVYDSTAPALELNSVATNTNTSRVITGTTDPFAEVTVTVHSTPQTKVTTADADGKWSVTFDGLEIGSHIVTVSSKDKAGNVAEVPTQNFEVTTVPVVPQSNSSGPTNQGQPLVAFNNATPSDSNQSSKAVTDNDGQVLAAQDVKKNVASTTGAIKKSDGTWGVVGIAWYWILVLLAVIAAAWWLIAAYRRRQNEA